ncbi:MAG TPA: hypothetical protein PKM27_17860 [Saprospiraceae bacterium]|nr:hypothetical protein [Saprospiraceae bacterium]HNT19364.1 hypothetical protein [Saprospiraceae bacterium]
MQDKKKILQQIRNHQEAMISELKATIQNLEHEADLPEGEVIDPEDASFQSASMEMLSHYRTLLVNAENDLYKLNNLSEVETDRVAPGALVVTDEILLYIGIPVKSIPMSGGRTLIGVSPDSEIVNQLEAKKTGDAFDFGDTTLVIRSIS